MKAIKSYSLLEQDCLPVTRALASPPSPRDALARVTEDPPRGRSLSGAGLVPSDFNLNSKIERRTRSQLVSRQIMSTPAINRRLCLKGWDTKESRLSDKIGIWKKKTKKNHRCFHNVLLVYGQTLSSMSMSRRRHKMTSTASPSLFYPQLNQH